MLWTRYPESGRPLAGRVTLIELYQTCLVQLVLIYTPVLGRAYIACVALPFELPWPFPWCMVIILRRYSCMRSAELEKNHSDNRLTSYRPSLSVVSVKAAKDKCACLSRPCLSYHADRSVMAICRSPYQQLVSLEMRCVLILLIFISDCSFAGLTDHHFQKLMTLTRKDSYERDGDSFVASSNPYYPCSRAGSPVEEDQLVPSGREAEKMLESQTVPEMHLSQVEFHPRLDTVSELKRSNSVHVAGHGHVVLREKPKMSSRPRYCCSILFTRYSCLRLHSAA